MVAPPASLHLLRMARKIRVKIKMTVDTVGVTMRSLDALYGTQRPEGPPVFRVTYVLKNMMGGNLQAFVIVTGEMV